MADLLEDGVSNRQIHFQLLLSLLPLLLFLLSSGLYLHPSVLYT